MQEFAHETYGPTDHFWVQVDLTRSHEYGPVFNPDPDLIGGLAQHIKANLSQSQVEGPHYWYFGSSLEEILLMVKLEAGQALVQVNLKDFDFALHANDIEAWKQELKEAVEA